jgi:hypothetical protein
MRKTAGRRLGLAVAGVAMVAACSSNPSATTAGPALSWAPGFTASANGPAGPIDLKSVCGSTSDRYLVEALHHPVTNLKVMKEWGGVFGGEQVLVSGVVATAHQGPGDLPMNHPLGDDLSMDVILDAPFTPYSQKLGTEASDTKPGQLHVEISSGFIPHLPATTPAPAGQTWRQASDAALTGFQPGFDHPAVGDRVLVRGRYIVDCGHADFHTELHPISFLAWTHQTATMTVVHVYDNDYWDTELFNPDLSLGGQVDDQSRFTSSQTKPFPKYLIDEVARLITGRTHTLRAFELLGVVPPAATNWQVCAPAGTKGSHLTVHYDLRTRPGIGVTVTPNKSMGCATVQTTEASAFVASDVPVRSCGLAWDYLNAIASVALSSRVDTRAFIKANLPAGLAPLVNPDPVTSCADPMAGPAANPEPAGTSVAVDGTQPFPIYGVMTVTRS